MKQELKDLIEAMKPGAKLIRAVICSNIVTDSDDDPVEPIQYHFAHNEEDDLEDAKAILDLFQFSYDVVDGTIYTDDMPYDFVIGVGDMLSYIIDSNLE